MIGHIVLLGHRALDIRRRFALEVMHQARMAPKYASDDYDMESVEIHDPSPLTAERHNHPTTRYRRYRYRIILLVLLLSLIPTILLTFVLSVTILLPTSILPLSTFRIRFPILIIAAGTHTP